MDVFIEQVVKRKRNARTTAIIIATIALLILVPLTCSVLAYYITAYLIYVGLFIFIIGIYIAWYVITSLRVEFEYSVASGALDIAKIISKRKRKKVCKVDIKDIELFCKADDKRLNEKRYTKHFYAAADPSDNENTYCAVYHSAVWGRTLLVFTPDEKIRGAMKPFLRKEIVLEMFYNRGQKQ